jgi:hypothetical protein
MPGMWAVDRNRDLRRQVATALVLRLLEAWEINACLSEFLELFSMASGFILITLPVF